MDDSSSIKVCEKCRRIRLVVVFLFMVSSVLAGVFWAHVGSSGGSDALTWAIVFTAISTVLILGVEVVVTKVELEAKRLYLQIKEKVEEIRILNEKIAERDRSLDLLAKDDDTVREQLLEERMHRAFAENNGKETSPAEAKSASGN